jgi:hypothetical protein
MVHNLRSEFDPHRHLWTEPGKSEKIIYTYLFTALRPKGLTCFFYTMNTVKIETTKT